jgi:hypothetical protein
VGVFAIVALWELAAPRRALTVSKALRWGSNLGLVALNTLVLRLVFPVGSDCFEVIDRVKATHGRAGWSTCDLRSRSWPHRSRRQCLAQSALLRHRAAARVPSQTLSR